MEVRAVRIKKKNGASFIKVLVNSEQSPISTVKKQDWLKHENKKFKYGFNFSEEFFREIKKIEVEEPKEEAKSTEEKLKELESEVKEIKGLLAEIQEKIDKIAAKEKQGK